MKNILKQLTGSKLDVNAENSEIDIQLFQLMDIFVYSNSFDENLCNDLIQYFEDNKKDAVNISEFDEGITIPIGTNEDLDNKVCKKFNMVLHKLSQTLNTPINVQDSGYNIVKYKIGSCSSNHIDGLFCAGQNEPRIFSCVTFLNDSDIGGDLHFPSKTVFIKPRTGTTVIFPGSYLTHLHRIMPTVTGNVYMLVTWLHSSQLGMPFIEN